MKEIFSKFYKVSIFSSIIFLIFGLLLYLSPEGIIATVSFVMGIFLLIVGIYSLIMYFKDKIYFKSNLISGIFALVAGILLITNTNIIATIVPIIIGICMIGLGARKLEISLNFKDNQVLGWSYMLIMGIITIICGIILIINPIKGAFIATKIIGIIIMIYSIIDIIDSIVFRNNLKKVNKIINQ